MISEIRGKVFACEPEAILSNTLAQLDLCREAVKAQQWVEKSSISAASDFVFRGIHPSMLPGSATVNYLPMKCHVQRAKILLVEDTEDDAFFFRHALDRTGLPYEITHLIDGGEAIDYLSALALGGSTAAMPDLIFLDLKLPKYSGFEILKWMNGQNFRPPPRVTILSGSDHPSDISTSRELGAADYVVKPISSEDLKRRILSLSQRDPEESERLAKRY